MKQSFIAFILVVICFTTSAQKITLSFQQDYLVPEIPVITQLGDTLVSSSPIGNQWFMNGVEIAGQTNQKMVITSSGNYTVGVTLGSGCSSESQPFKAIKTDVSIIQTADFTCTVFPNPNHGLFTVELESDQPVVFDLELFTSAGGSIIKQSVNHPAGKQLIPFGKSFMAAGVYYLQITHGEHSLSRQIIVR